MLAKKAPLQGYRARPGSSHKKGHKTSLERTGEMEKEGRARNKKERGYAQICCIAAGSAALPR